MFGRFYIILRGQVSVLHKDAFEDVDLGDEGQQKKVDRSTLGSSLVVLGTRIFGGARGEAIFYLQSVPTRPLSSLVC